MIILGMEVEMNKSVLLRFYRLFSLISFIRSLELFSTIISLQFTLTIKSFVGTPFPYLSILLQLQNGIRGHFYIT